MMTLREMAKMRVHTETRPFDKLREWSDIPKTEVWRAVTGGRNALDSQIMAIAMMHREAMPRIIALKKAMAEGGHVNRDVNKEPLPWA